MSRAPSDTPLLKPEAFSMLAVATGKTSMPVEGTPVPTGSLLRRMLARSLRKKAREAVLAAQERGLAGSAAMDAVVDALRDTPEAKNILRIIAQETYDKIAEERGLKVSRPLPPEEA